MDKPAPVYILGSGLAGPIAEDPRSIPEMVLDAVEAALSDAGLDWSGVDAVVTASADLIDGLTASNIAVTEVVGAVMRPETRVAADGLAAACHATLQVRAGTYETVLAVAHAKASMSNFWDLSTWAVDPIMLQPLGIDFRVVAGLQAARLAAGEPDAVRRWAELVASRRLASRGWAGESTADAILESPPFATPLTTGMVAPLGDAAAAVVLSRELGSHLIAGIGFDLSTHPAIGEPMWDGLRRASERAFDDAGLGVADVTDAEPSCIFPFEEALFARATGIGPDCEVSKTGGLFGGTAPIAAGLSRLIEATDPSHGITLAHGTWGPGGQGQAVILSRPA